jgi:hypothetical protein
VFGITIRSRFGNGVLGVLGAVYFLSASTILVYYVVTTWGAASTIDRLLQFALIASAVGGLLFIGIAADNLGLRRRHDSVKSHSTRDHRTTAAAGP